MGVADAVVTADDPAGLDRAPETTAVGLLVLSALANPRDISELTKTR